VGIYDPHLAIFVLFVVWWSDFSCFLWSRGLKLHNFCDLDIAKSVIFETQGFDFV
jgi:hypothetical protein